jgi:3-oxoacyl-[acyl-carrier protein] reductase
LGADRLHNGPFNRRGVLLEAPVVLVTGSSRGSGRALAVRLAAGGYSVALNYLKGRGAAEEAQAIIESCGGSCTIKPFGVSQRQESMRAIAEVIDAIGPMSILR